MTLTVDGYRLISNSEVQVFKQCLRKWYQAYYLGLVSRRTENPASVTAIGTRYHECLAGYYVPDGEAPTHPLETHALVVERTLGELHANAHAQGYPVADELLKKLQSAFSLERVMLEGYLEWLTESGEDSQLEVIASEQYLEAVFLPGVKIIGKIDARVRSTITGRRRFIDHKSVASFVEMWELRNNPQMKHYHLLEILNTPPGEPGCDGAFYSQSKRSKRTAKATGPFYVREFVPHNRHEIENYRKQLTGTITQIMRTERALDATGGIYNHEILPPSPSESCSWKCPFTQVCGMFDDGSRIEAALEHMFDKHNPLDYYKGSERGEEGK